MLSQSSGSRGVYNRSFSHLKDTLFGKDATGVAELQQQVAELKLERSQLLKAVTESQHDAACLAEHVRQIGQLKQVLASVQQENAELSKGSKGAAASNKEKSLQSLHTLETQVVQLQSRLAYMEEEKGRLVAAAKGKNEQVTSLEQRCQQLEADVQKLAQSWTDIVPAQEVQVAKQGSMAEQQLHQQQLKALHEDLEALQAQYAADAESWSGEQAALQADLASLAAQTALKSLALDAMLRAGGATGFASAGHAVDGPLWQQDQDTLTHALLAEQEWLATLTQKIVEVQINMQQSQSIAPTASPSQDSQSNKSQYQTTPAAAQAAAAAQPVFKRASATDSQSESAESITSIRTAPEAVDYILLDQDAADQVAQSLNIPTAADAEARHEAPARMQLTLAEELADDDHHLVTEQQHRHHRYATGDLDLGLEAPLISLAAASEASSKRTSRSTADVEASWTLMSYKVDSNAGVPLGSVPVGTLAEEAATLMKGVFAAGNGSMFQATMPGGLLDNARQVKGYRLTSEQDSYQPPSAQATR